MEDLRGDYYNWILGCIATAQSLGLKDSVVVGGTSYKVGDTGKFIQDIIIRLGQSSEGLTSDFPFVDDYYGFAFKKGRVTPQEEQLPEWAMNGSVVVPSKLIRLPDGSYVDYNGIKVDPDTALSMMKDFLGTKDDSTLTAYEEGALNQALQELLWEKEQFGTLSASDKAALQLAYDQLQQTRNEWHARLQANPADFIEKWYAEHLPAGTQMPATTPWGEAAVGTPEWMQQYSGGGVTPSGGAATPGVGAVGGAWQPTGQGGNQWATPEGTPDIEAINAWTGRQQPGAPPENLSPGTSYGNLPSYEVFMRQYPNSSITPEAYYSQAGAYELAAYYNPAYAYGAQQAQVALVAGEITGAEYQAMQQANFVDAQGNPLAQRTAGQKGVAQVAAGWAQAQSPAGYLSTLQAQGIPPSQWASRSKNPDVSAYLGGAAEALAAPLPTPAGSEPWSSYLKGGAMYKAGSAGSWGAKPSYGMPAGVNWGSIYGG